MLVTGAQSMVAGVLPLDPDMDRNWIAAGAWQMPVGAPGLLGAPGAPNEPPFVVNRGVEHSGGRVTHQGVDLANGEAGASVRAAAAGIVALAFDDDNGNGYGGHVVLAHRLEGERLVYSVYAHLARGSIAVRTGEVVCAGDLLGHVGQTGRASTPHLHFEVREPDQPGQRWERAVVLDPLAFVMDRAGAPLAALADPAGESDLPRAYVRWATGQGLLGWEAVAEAPLTRSAWWRALARAAEGGSFGGARGEALRDSLIGRGILPEEEGDAPGDEHLGWEELARDVRRLREIGVLIPHGPLPARDHEAACEARYGVRSPAEHTGALRKREGEPTVADASYVLADLSGPRPGPHLGPGPHGARVAKAQPHRHRRRSRAHPAKRPATPVRRRSPKRDAA